MTTTTEGMTATAAQGRALRATRIGAAVAALVVLGALLALAQTDGRGREVPTAAPADRAEVRVLEDWHGNVFVTPRDLRGGEAGPGGR